MNASLHCIVLLACVVACFCTPIKRCQCTNAIQRVNPKFIRSVQVHYPRPYCKNQEVIVRLKDKTITCLDPESKFTKDIVKAVEKQRASQATKKGTSVMESTTETQQGSNTIVA